MEWINDSTPRLQGRWRPPARIRYTAPFMSYTFAPSTAHAAAFQGMGMMQCAFTRAMGARMITTITAVAT
jgi:hypothetical protein